MLRILLDQVAPFGLRRILTGHEVKTVKRWGWDRMTGPRIAVVILSTKHGDTIKVDPSAVVAACAGAGQGRYTVVRRIG